MTVIRSTAEKLTDATLALEKARQSVLESRQRIFRDERDLETAQDNFNKCKELYEKANAAFQASLEDGG